MKWIFSFFVQAALDYEFYGCNSRFTYGLSITANKNAEHPVKFEFQIILRILFEYKFIPCSIRDILLLIKKNSKYCLSEKQILTGLCVFYLANLCIELWANTLKLPDCNT